MTVGTTALSYRPCVGMMVINGDGLIWIGHRANAGRPEDFHQTWWQMPQGGIDDGEDPYQAALRELCEETGITSVEKIGELDEWQRYDLPAELRGRVWGGKFRGQAQKWFALRFTGDDDEVNIQRQSDTFDIEFDAWRWAPVDALLDTVVYFKRDVYQRVVDGLGHLAVPRTSPNVAGNKS